MDNVLHYVHLDGSLRVIPPTSTRQVLFYQAHGGIFGDHLGDAKVYSEFYADTCDLRLGVILLTGVVV